ncbi:MAG: hypothetical protein FGM14_12315 [Flavobacteriales bacterium]|nr:hypothetical protein [Flavobacteriales bacterium]
MTYHETIIDLVHHVLSKGIEYYKNVDSGNAFDKILRNYHQFNLNGDKVYRRTSKMAQHYRYSENAWKLKNNLSELYFEHLIPLKITKEKLQELIASGNVSHDSIKTILDENEIVVITRDEQKIVDADFKSSLPKESLDRLAVVGIKIEEQTKLNRLF